jgi:IS1 family transposase
MFNILDRSSIILLFCHNKNKPMYQLNTEKRIQIINLLVEGNSVRATSRLSGVAFNTVIKLLVQVGNACESFHNRHVLDVASRQVQCDEMWNFLYSKKANTPAFKSDAGDMWLWIALDPDSKLVISWLSSKRTMEAANIFMKDLAGRLKNRVQISTDGLIHYVKAVSENLPDSDFGQMVKVYGKRVSKNGQKYTREICIGHTKTKILGNPDEHKISTSLIERQNLTVRMGMRRFTRKTNAFSKKFENHCLAIALHFVHYNFIRIHQSLKMTPAMAAGVIDHPITIRDLINMLDVPGPRDTQIEIEFPQSS